MPLIKSTSKKARQKNIEEMIAAGHPVKNSVAAGYSNQRKYEHKSNHVKRHSEHKHAYKEY